MKWITWLLYVIICVYSALDTYHTKLAIEAGVAESNFLLSSLGEVYSSFGLLNTIICTKLLFILMLGVGLYMQLKRQSSKHCIHNKEI